MKKYFWKSFFLFALITSMFEACQKDSETDPASTSTSDRDKFLGTWITVSNGTSGTLNFTMDIVINTSSPDQIIIKNFDAEGNNTTTFADVSGNNLVIAKQHVGIHTDTIQGTGTYNNNNTLSFSYAIVDGQTIDNRTATAHK